MLCCLCTITHQQRIWQVIYATGYARKNTGSAHRILRFCPTEQGNKNSQKSKYYHAATRVGESSKNGVALPCLMAWTLCQSRDLPVKHNRLSDAVMQKKGASDAFCAFPDTSGHVKSDQIHLFSSVQTMQMMKLLHLLLLLFDHLSYHLSTDGTSLA